MKIPHGFINKLHVIGGSAWRDKYAKSKFLVAGVRCFFVSAATSPAQTQSRDQKLFRPTYADFLLWFEINKESL